MQISTSHNHFKETTRLAIPLVLTQVGHIITGLVDYAFLGQLGKTEQAVGSLSNNLFVILLVFSIGMSYALTPVTSEAHINGNEKEKASLFKNSLLLNVLVALVLFIALYFSSPLLGYMQQPADVVELTIPFFNVMIFSIIPISLFFVCKQYSEGLSNTKAAMYISIIGNLINVILNYALIYGKFGCPQLGYMGSCWATFIARVLMGIGFLIYVFKHPSINSFAVYFKEAKINAYHFIMLLKDGLASGFQFTFEVSAFCIAGLMAGVFGKEQIVAHGIALNLASFTYMFASGISSATTIRVSNYFAMHDVANIKKAMGTSFKMVLYVMGFMALTFVILNKWLPTCFSNDDEIILITSRLLLFAAFFQLLDGVQVVAIGVLRGMEDYQYSSVVAFIAYWLVALPLAYTLAFVAHWSVYGIWCALSVALGIAAIALFVRIKVVIEKIEIS